MARASSSLPVPDSPSSSTVACEGAAFMTISMARLPPQDLQRLPARARGHDPQRLALEDLLERLDDGGLVVDHQDCRRGALCWHEIHPFPPINPGAILRGIT